MTHKNEKSCIYSFYSILANSFDLVYQFFQKKKKKNFEMIWDLKVVMYPPLWFQNFFFVFKSSIMFKTPFKHI